MDVEMDESVINDSYVEDYQEDLEHKVDNVDEDLDEDLDESEEEESSDDEADGMDGNKMYFAYPILPENMDFETFRKQYKTWKDIITFYNKPLLANKTNTEKKRIYRERFITGSWERCPNYEFIGDIPEGKHTNNGIPVWGATLFDFYNILRCPGVRLSTSGSRIAAWMSIEGGKEIEFCKQDMKQAYQAMDPYELRVYDIGLILEAIELRANRGRVGKRLRPLPEEKPPHEPKPKKDPDVEMKDVSVKKEEEKDDNDKMDEDEKEKDEGDDDDAKTKTKEDKGKGKEEEPPKPKPFDFDLTHGYQQALYELSKYPDPWPLRPFSAPLPRFQKRVTSAFLPRRLIVHDPWGITQVSSSQAIRYRSLTEAKRCKWGTTEDVVQIYELDKLEKRNKEDFHPFTDVDPPVPEAHLYLSPKRRIGTGNHSFVYQAELELPRGMLVTPRMCKECAEKLWKKAKKELDEIKPGSNEADRHPVDIRTRELFQQMYGRKKKNPGAKLERSDLTSLEANVMSHMRLFEQPPFCEHLKHLNPRVPPSQRVSVSVKLSLPDDRHGSHSQHLKEEAENYRTFPPSMYQHWNGYNLIHPIKDPTPVGAVCPQYYGFYNPSKVNKPKKEGRFMSSILLLEHCGLQINVEGLSVDDKHECVSLIRRLHIAGYRHNSPFERNILIQNGPLMFPPWKRSAMHRRFRLIDFGRTRKSEEGKQFWDATEELRNVMESLALEFPQMGYEFGK